MTDRERIAKLEGALRQVHGHICNHVALLRAGVQTVQGAATHLECIAGMIDDVLAFSARHAIEDEQSETDANAQAARELAELRRLYPMFKVSPKDPEYERAGMRANQILDQPAEKPATDGANAQAAAVKGATEPLQKRIAELEQLRRDCMDALDGEMGTDADDGSIVSACLEWRNSVRALPENAIDPEVDTLDEVVEKLLQERDGNFKRIAELEDKLAVAEHKLESSRDTAALYASQRDANAKRIAELDEEAGDWKKPPKTISVREAARKRYALGGPDCQALEGAISLTERERDDALASVKKLEEERETLKVYVRNAQESARLESQRAESNAQAARELAELRELALNINRIEAGGTPNQCNRLSFLLRLTNQEENPLAPSKCEQCAGDCVKREGDR